MRWIKTEYAHSSKSGKTGIWNVLSKDGDKYLGNISWHSPWRRYCFYPAAYTLFEQDCLRDIAKEIESLTKAHPSVT